MLRPPPAPRPPARILLLTGKGGVGKSTLAAATAARCATAGLRTLVLSTDGAHSLAEAFDRPVGSRPTQVAPGLHVQHVDSQLLLERSWAQVQRYLRTVLDVVGTEPLAAEELTVLPGADEVLALLELRDQALGGDWDAVIVDCAPTAETLRLLALPEVLGWYLERLLPHERRLAKALAPLVTRTAGVPLPDAPVLDAVGQMHRDLAGVAALLTGPRAAVRLVLTPETLVLAEARRSWTSLSLFGYRVDGVIANRIFPDEPGDDWRAGWVAAQSRVLAEAEESFSGLAVWRCGYQSREPVGIAALRDLGAELYRDRDPLAAGSAAAPFRVERVGAGAVLRLALPLVTRASVDLARSGDDLVVTVGSARRLVSLPAGLARLAVAGAAVSDGELRVRFEEPTRTADRPLRVAVP